MKLQGAVIREQGVTFAVVVVKQHVVDNTFEAERAIRALQLQVFRGLPVVLMAQDASGQARYRGRSDLARFLARVPLRAIPWKEYTIN